MDIRILLALLGGAVLGIVAGAYGLWRYLTDDLTADEYEYMKAFYMAILEKKYTVTEEGEKHDEA